MDLDTLTTTVSTDTVRAANAAAAQRLADLRAYADRGYQLMSTVTIPAVADDAQVILDTLARPAR